VDKSVIPVSKSGKELDFSNPQQYPNSPQDFSNPQQYPNSPQFSNAERQWISLWTTGIGMLGLGAWFF
jgi:hypothetical protein